MVAPPGRPRSEAGLGVPIISERVDCYRISKTSARPTPTDTIALSDSFPIFEPSLDLSITLTWSALATLNDRVLVHNTSLVICATGIMILKGGSDANDSCVTVDPSVLIGTTTTVLSRRLTFVRD